MPEVQSSLQVQAQPYLFFAGRCEEALEFYRQVLGAEITMMMRHKDNPEPNGAVSADFAHKIMHASFEVGGSHFMASDGMCQGTENFQGFSLHLQVPDSATAERFFAGLSQGGQVRMPLTKTFWSPLFGMVCDRFGVGWMISLPE